MVHKPALKAHDPNGLRRRILDASATLFLANGFNATSMKHLLGGAGVSAGAMYHHFPTKKACVLYVIRERVAPVLREVWIEPLRKAESAEAAVRTIMREIADGFDATGCVRGCLLNNLSVELSFADPDYRSEIQQIFQEWRTALVQKIESDVAAGALRNDIDPAGLATVIMAAYSGAIVLSGAEQNTRPLRQCARQLSIVLEQARPGVGALRHG